MVEALSKITAKFKRGAISWDDCDKAVKEVSGLDISFGDIFYMSINTLMRLIATEVEGDSADGIFVWVEVCHE